MQVNSSQQEGKLETTVSFFGQRTDSFLYMQAGLSMEGIKTDVYDLGEFPQNRDNYMRHLVFETPDKVNTRELVRNGRLLFEYFEMTERHDEVIAEEVAAILDLPEPDYELPLHENHTASHQIRCKETPPDVPKDTEVQIYQRVA